MMTTVAFLDEIAKWLPSLNGRKGAIQQIWQLNGLTGYKRQQILTDNSLSM